MGLSKCSLQNWQEYLEGLDVLFSLFGSCSDLSVVSTSGISSFTCVTVVDSGSFDCSVGLSSDLVSSLVLELTSGEICSKLLLVDTRSLAGGVASTGLWQTGVALRRDGVGGGEVMLNTLPGDMLRSDRLCGEKLRVDWL